MIIKVLLKMKVTFAHPLPLISSCGHICWPPLSIISFRRAKMLMTVRSLWERLCHLEHAILSMGIPFCTKKEKNCYWTINKIGESKKSCYFLISMTVYWGYSKSPLKKLEDRQEREPLFGSAIFMSLPIFIVCLF